MKPYGPGGSAVSRHPAVVWRSACRRLAAMARAARDGVCARPASSISSRSAGRRCCGSNRSAAASPGRRSPRPCLCHGSHGRQARQGEESAGKDGLASKERVLCFAAADGKLLWKHEYDCTYRVLYERTARDLRRRGRQGLCPRDHGRPALLDAAKGDVLWRKSLPELGKTKPPVWGYASHPLVDGDLVYTLAGGDNSAVIALDKDTGARSLASPDGERSRLRAAHDLHRRWQAAAHRLAHRGDRRPRSRDRENLLVAGVSRRRAGAAGYCGRAPRLENDLLFVSSPHHGSLMLRLGKDKPGAEVVERQEPRGRASG